MHKYGEKAIYLVALLCKVIIPDINNSLITTLMKKVLLLFILFSVGLSVNGQNSPILKSNYLQAARFSPENVNKMVYTLDVNPMWLEKSNRFWYTYQTSDGTSWYIVDADKGIKRPLFDNSKMAADITRVVRDPYDAQHLPIQSLKFNPDEKAFRFTVTSKVEEVEKPDPDTGKPKKEKKKYYFEYDLASATLTHLDSYEPPKPIPSWASISPDQKWVIFGREYNLYYMDAENFAKAIENEKDSTIVEHQLTTDGIRHYAYSGGREETDKKEDTIKRRRAGVTWSPDSKNFIVMRTDQRDVKDLWVINSVASPRPTLETYKYQIPGETESPISYMYMCDMDSKMLRKVDISAFKDQTVGMMQGEPIKIQKGEFTIRIPVWMGDDSEFYFNRTSRDLKRIDICRVDVKSLEVKPVIEERFNTYIEKIELKNPNGKGGDLIHWSERDGWAHLYRYGYDGTLKNQITSGPYHVERILEVDDFAKVIYFTACGKEANENPYYEHIYRVSFDGTGLKLLSPGDYFHKINMSDGGKYFVDNYSRVNTIPKAALFDNTGRKVMDLETADFSKLFESGYKFPEIFKVKADDGITDLYGVLYKPFDFDSTKLYPIIEYVYPGPQVEAVEYAYKKISDRLDRLAQLGFIIVTVGNRGGHPARSKWYHTYGYGNLRDYGLADKKTAAIQLADQRKYMDITKVGIHGHSGGGFMSTAAMLVYPDFFKVAVSCAGNHDNAIYNRWWSEKHHGITETVSDKGDTTFKYSIDNNAQVAKNLKGKLLLVHGDIDNNVHPANTTRVVDALIKANKRFDMLMLPGQRHAFGDMTEYFFWRMADYFSEHLIGDSEGSVDIPQLSK